MQCDGGLNRIAYDPHHFLPAVNGGFLPPLSPVPAPIAGWFNQKQERRREEFFFFFAMRFYVSKPISSLFRGILAHV